MKPRRRDQGDPSLLHPHDGASTEDRSTAEFGELSKMATLDTRFPDDKSTQAAGLTPHSSAGASFLLRVPRAVGEGDLEATLRLVGRPTRYVRGPRLGEGGMGAVYQYRDEVLKRDLAIKVPHPEMAQVPALLRRFIREAQITAQLDHPNIVPLYDLMRTPDGQLAYVMKKVDGKPLSEILDASRRGDAEVRRTFGLRALLLVFRQVVGALAFAHDRGIIHRDVKPDNILVGRYGEVLLTDWGLAKPWKETSDDFDHDAGMPARLMDLMNVDSTRIAGVLGALRFVAPEQAEGADQPMGPWSDVYSLGVVLYCILTGQTPFVPGKGEQAPDFVQRVRTFDPPHPQRRSQWGAFDTSLERICLKCLEKTPHERYADAGELYQELESYLEGAKEREKRQMLAQKAIEKAQDARRKYDDLTAFFAQKRQEARAAEEKVAAHDLPEQKKALWDAQDQAQRVAMSRVRVFNEIVSALGEALANDPTSVPARQQLAEAYFQRALEAEAQGQVLEKAYYEEVLRSCAPPAIWEQWEAGGRVAVVTQPSGALLRVARFVEEGRVLVPRDERVEGVTPIKHLHLPQGSYLLTLEAKGVSPTRVPLHIGRGTVANLQIPLYTEAEIGAGFAYIPQGTFLSGGDPEWEATPREEVWVDGFAMGILPITAEEYCVFLNALAEVRPGEAARRAPRDPEKQAPLWVPDASGRFRIPEVDHRGNRWNPKLPIFLVNYHDAETYCAFRTQQEGVSIRLPTRWEWEKAGRGTDGRYHPWGNHFDPAFCKMRESRRERDPQPEPVGLFPVDCSPYGVRDLAGGVADWCSTWENEGQQKRFLGGGAWFVHARNCRLGRRYGFKQTDIAGGVGFRVCKSLPVR